MTIYKFHKYYLIIYLSFLQIYLIIGLNKKLKNKK